MTVGSKIKLGVPAIAISIVLLLGTWQLITTGILFLSAVGLKVEKPTSFEFTELSTLLKNYSSDGLVDYAALKGSPALSAAVARLETTSPINISSKRDLLAFWLNAYNLSIIKMVADHYPVSTIQQMGNAPSAQKFLVGGKPYSTQDMYLRFITPLAKSEVPKAVFLSCGGALGFPKLSAHVLRGQSLEGDAEGAAQTFVDDPDNIAFLEKDNQVFLSPFFTWNLNIITMKYATLDDFIVAYLPSDKAKLFCAPNVLRSYNKPFNWRINNKTVAK